MKRKIFLLGALALCLTGCGQKNKAKTPNSSEQKAIQAKAEQLQKDNKSILQKLKKIKSSLEPLSFQKMTRGHNRRKSSPMWGIPLKKVGDHQCDGNR